MQVGRALQLSFTLPELATDGGRLTKPLEIQIWRALTPAGAPPPAASAAVPWKSFAAPQVAAHTRDGKFHYTLRLTEAEFTKELGSTFTFAARGLTRRFRGRIVAGAWSHPVSATLLDVSGPPQHLQVHATKNALKISWAAPAQSLTGGLLPPLTGFRLFRSSTGAANSFHLLAEPSGTGFADSQFRFGSHYYFKVRAVFKQGKTTAASEDSPVVEISPRDIFPPAAPHNVRAVYAAGAVEVTWTANAEPDLAGYNVYRRRPDGSFQKINPQLLRTPIFRDTAVEPGRTYAYRVTALDLAGNESLPSATITIETR